MAGRVGEIGEFDAALEKWGNYIWRESPTILQQTGLRLTRRKARFCAASVGIPLVSCERWLHRPNPGIKRIQGARRRANGTSGSQTAGDSI